MAKKIAELSQFDKVKEDAKKVLEEAEERSKKAMEGLLAEREKMLKIQEDLNQGPRKRLSNLQKEKERAEGILVNYDINTKTLISEIEQEIKEKGSGHMKKTLLIVERQSKRTQQEGRMNTVLAPILLDIAKTELEILKGEQKYLDLDLATSAFESSIYNNAFYLLDGLQLSLKNHVPNIERVETLSLSIHAKLQQVTKKQNEIRALEKEDKQNEQGQKNLPIQSKPRL